MADMQRTVGEGIDVNGNVPLVAQLLAIPNLTPELKTGILKGQIFWNRLKSSISNASTWDEVLNAEQNYFENLRQLAVYTTDPNAFKNEINKAESILTVSRKIGNSRQVISQADKQEIMDSLNARSNAKQVACITAAVGASLAQGATLIGITTAVGAVYLGYECYTANATPVQKRTIQQLIQNKYLDSQNANPSQIAYIFRDMAPAPDEGMPTWVKTVVVVLIVSAVIGIIGYFAGWWKK